ncbi:DUF2938 domain-containing protein [uncultured Roseobacter sp.]|uniref:DUF2938 domain-containing protein n=1 Tax=uncultured Roseobacter sp. TaxID=114847 RepID=UPI002639253A|nr:DUF2938 domain-containing protein [uncultured Roseobacter sp.]
MDSLVITGVVMGLVATVALDLWALLLARVAGLPVTNWAMVGRWVAHLPRGTLFHDDIARAAPVTAEKALGWGFHYAVGVAYGIALALLMGPAWTAAPTLVPAWVFSILMLGFGWFLLQPGLGLGMAASRTPNPGKARALGLIAHTVFGLGLWAGALL